MNYFAHGHRLLDEPYALAGTALPDWLGAADRRARLRRDRIGPDGFGQGGDPRARALARGIARHYEDDAWFHATEAFQRTASEATRLLREASPDDPRFRAWFLGHVLVEMLLDRFLIAEDPRRLGTYYDALDEVDARWLEMTISPWLTRAPRDLQRSIGLFRRTRFMFGYLDDDGLADRLARLARRVGLPPLPDGVRTRIRLAARMVEERVPELMRSPCSPPA